MAILKIPHDAPPILKEEVDPVTQSPDLKSSVQEKGSTVTQIIHFVGGIKKTFPGVITKSIVQGQFTHFDTLDGRRVMIHDKNVLFVEIFS